MRRIRIDPTQFHCVCFCGATISLWSFQTSTSTPGPMTTAIARRVGAFALGVVVCYFARFAFSKFKEVNAKSLTAVIGCLLLGTATTQLVSHLFSDEVALAVYPIGLLTGLLIYPLIAERPDGAMEGDKPSQTWSEKLVAFIRRKTMSKCRIFVFGLSRSGKTMLIQQILGILPPTNIPSTRDFVVYDGTRKLQFDEGDQIEIAVCDYRGQRPSQVLQDPPRSFFGPRGSRVVNILVFLVDCVPEIQGKNDSVLDDSEIVERYAKGARKKIAERIEEHEQYVSSPIIEMAFRASFSKKNLFAVRLLMNKVDLLEQFIERGYLDGTNPEDLERFTMQLVKEIGSRVRKACEENKIDDYSIGLLSAKKGSNVKEIFGPLFKSHLARSGAGD
jgi:GTPase SAR1 family protein